MNKRLIINLEGRVQRVGFRVYASSQAESRDLTGYVKNEVDRSLTIITEGPEDKLKELAEWAKHGPRMAWVTKMKMKWEEATEEFNKFEIRY
ncbi:acylphosphatase [bacterium CG_4_10_14_0_2_um_filter_33_32]|nr:MAG: hypothetical protein AUJ93_03545 [bacterium CG2_30_33_46]PIR67937.1 MAG: acylphosphatase [bacterium CG10_big_fil_rev_8_21_14_0_10_33_18]PIU76854.1 MAG: acylphosphatase [bacterium CG06_land_8_20_14_3_00_33_50]PIW81556.1 MAG: acylphosphatase [bacterium CG_4_8_14_3_um_filter_33_28]PIY85391.1 MAG: acylphosphatase [bacterium CG_4_10_14_0_8_um_filter_33_57]PIZ86334.1 MAG: acylphosphatase [bacterium CG_4_10_14_0_2_um_filter_33_32]PJA72180.1 MAG: acylphosphatase [bacterium CG_4_9_14_3_um_filt